jgi:hypothetical protein
MASRTCRRWAGVFVGAFTLHPGVPSPAQNPAPPPPLANWAGAIRCELQSQAGEYAHQETQTWTLTGGAPTVQGSVTVYPATWNVAGQGWHDRTRGANRRIAQWTVNVPGANAPVSAPIGLTLRPVGGRFDVAKWHAQLTAPGGYTGPEQYINDGVSQTPRRLVQTVYEWQFPRIEAATSDTQLTGANTVEVRAFLGPLQPEDAQSHVTCTWALGRGSAPPLPPSAMPRLSPPPSIAQGGAPPPGGQVATTPAPTGLPGGATAPTTTTAPPAPPTSAPTAPVQGGGIVQTSPGGGGLTVSPSSPAATPSSTPTAPTAATARDPANFSATQTGDGTVVLTWTAVPGAGSYLLGGPGTNVGITVTGLSQTLTGIPQGTHTWTVATIYNPGGVLTTANQWSRATTTVTNTSGRYRITLSGYRVNRATFDERVNGNGDEVQAAVGVVTIDRRDASVAQPWSVVKSDPYGDVGRNPGYVRAGSFTPTGGLWAGDVVPAGTDPRMGSSTPSATRFPLAIWEGTLRDGIDALVVKPTLWEIDGKLDVHDRWVTLRDALGNFQQPWRNATVNAQDHAAQMVAIKDRADRGDLTVLRGTPVVFCSELFAAPDNCDGGFDRPIGVHKVGCIGLAGGGGTSAWCDLAVVFTREGIERALSATSQVGGVPPGLITIPLIEPPGVDAVTGGYDGSYELYLRVERLP